MLLLFLNSCRVSIQAVSSFLGTICPRYSTSILAYLLNRCKVTIFFPCFRRAPFSADTHGLPTKALFPNYKEILTNEVLLMGDLPEVV